MPAPESGVNTAEPVETPDFHAAHFFVRGRRSCTSATKPDGTAARLDHVSVICVEVEPLAADARTGTDTDPVILRWSLQRNVYVPAAV